MRRMFLFMVGVCITFSPFILQRAGGADAVTPIRPPPKILTTAAVKLPLSVVLPGPVTDYVLRTFSSDWAEEWYIKQRVLPATGFSFTESSGRSDEHIKPFWLLRNLKTRRGIAISLAWCGNWQLHILPDGPSTRIVVNTFPPGEKPYIFVRGMPIPGAVVDYFHGNWDNGAQPITRFIRDKLLRTKDLVMITHGRWPLVQYNDWYAADGRSNEKTLLRYARIARKIGCELFVVDGGWYGHNSRDLGKWAVDRKKFPRGLRDLARAVRGMGMKFGLWIEIECANPQSPVARRHPDWFLSWHGRRLSNRALLNFGNPKVRAWAEATISRLVTQYKLAYLKMDFNTNFPIPTHSRTLKASNDPVYKHYCGLIDVWRYIRRKFPNLIVENCSSGSLRATLMSSAFSDTNWISDNISNKANYVMMYGATYMFPPTTCSHWTVRPQHANQALDLAAKFQVNMPGMLGLSGDISKWNARTLSVAAREIALYKKIRPMLRHATVYHLTKQANPWHPQTWQALLYVDDSTGQALLFVFRGGAKSSSMNLRLRGLDRSKSYNIVSLTDPANAKVYPAGSLIYHGLEIKLSSAGDSELLELTPTHGAIGKGAASRHPH